MYRSKVYRERPLETVLAEAKWAAAQFPKTRKIFLADGDAWTLPTDYLLELLRELGSLFPDLMRVSAYAWPLALRKKTDRELAQLSQLKLNLAYVGVETGSAALLKKITKGSSPEIHAEAIERFREAGVKVSATVILGLGGKTHWKEHIDETVELIEKAPPRFVSTLQLGLSPEIEDEFYRKFKEPFQPQDDLGMLVEQQRFLSLLNPPRPVIFRSNHASNSLALAGVLPKDSARLVKEVEEALMGQRRLRPRNLRGY